MKYKFEDYLYEFDTASLVILETNRQRSRLSREIGGQLFARFHDRLIKIESVTITKGKSRRTRFGFWPDRSAEQADIKNLFEQGLHYIGDWHTHPEAIPTPSETDKSKMLEIFRLSTHELDSMLIVIVGLSPFPEGLFVGSVQQRMIKGGMHIRA